MVVVLVKRICRNFLEKSETKLSNQEMVNAIYYCVMHENDD